MIKSIRNQIILLVALLLASFLNQVDSLADTDQDWLVHVKKFNLKFKSKSDEIKKLTAFMRNKNLIEKHNSNESNSFKLKINSRSHYSPEEFRQAFLLKVNLTERIIKKQNEYFSKLASKQSPSRYTIPKTKTTTTTTQASVLTYWNWVDKGAVGPVLNQKDCGCCYAFVTSGITESAIAIKTSRKLQLSKQQIVDCTNDDYYQNLGCNGGYISNSLQYVIDRGLVPERDYPYKNRKNNCSFQNVTSLTSRYYLDRYGEIGYKDTENMMFSLLNYGPLIAYIAASSPYFQMYASGVLDDSTCKSYGIDHVVLIVGFGYDNVSNKDYWIVKNSWDTDWGENGYMKIARGKNICGIETDTYYAVY